MLGVTNLLTPLSYANAADVDNYDAANKTIRTGKSFSFVMPDHDVWLYAITAPNHYIVDYYGNTHTSWTMSGTEFTYDQSWYLETNTFKKTWYTFDWWNTQTGWGGTPYTDHQQVKNLTTEDGKRIPIYAQWTSNRYNIVYNLNDGSGTSRAVSGNEYPTSLAYDETWTILHPTRTWYTFSGWHIQNMDSETHNIGWVETNSGEVDHEMATKYENLRATSGTVQFAARWDADLVDYKVKHYLQDLNGGYTILSGTDELQWEADTEVKPNVNHYVGFQDATPYSGNIDADGTTVFTYNYPRRTYELQLIAGRWVASVSATGTVTTGTSTTGTTTIEFKFEEPITLSFALKEWYQTGTWSWYLDDDDDFNMPSGNIVKEAYAVPITYKIEVDLKWGTGTYPTGYNIETTPDINFDDPTGIDSDFLWWIGTDLSWIEDDVVIPTGSTWNRSYTAQWQCHTWYKPITTGQDGHCIARDDTTYTIDHQQQNLDSTYSHYEYGTGVGTTSGSTSGRDYVKPYEWFTVSEVETWTIKWDGSTSIIIKYDRNSYNITVTEGAGSEGTGIHTTAVWANDSHAAEWKHQYGDTITLSHTEDDGYTFDHWVVKNASWDVIATLSSGSNTFTMPASDVTIESYSTTNVYKVWIDKNWGTGGTNSGKTYTVVDTVTLNNPSRDHSTFVWWSWTDLSWVVHDVTFSGRSKDSYYEAIWSCVPWYHTGVDECVANEYTVSIDYNYPEGTGHGSASDSTGFTYDKTWHIDNPEESWYTFVWWTISWMTSWAIIWWNPASWTSASGVMDEEFKNLTTVESGNVTFVAVWEANDDTKYRVYHYTENLTWGWYHLEETELLQWTSDYTITLADYKNTYSWFAYSGWYTSWSISGPSGDPVTTVKIDRHGTTEIHLYYKRVTYQVFLSGDAHVESLSWTWGRGFRYGQDVEVSAEPMTWYHFVKWEKRGSGRAE